MAEFIDVTIPIARAIVCLESPHTTPADVLLYVTAAMKMCEETLLEMAKKKSTTGLKPPIDAIVAILKRRFNELINSKNGHDVYFSATVMHPGKLIGYFNTCILCPNISLLSIGHLTSDVLKKPNPLDLTITINRSTPAPIKDGRPSPKVTPAAAKRAATFLYSLLTRLRDTGNYPLLNKFSKKVLTSYLENGFESYIRGMYPYSQYAEGQDVLEWWREVGKTSPSAEVLSVCMINHLIPLLLR